MKTKSTLIDIRNCLFGFKCTAFWNDMLQKADINIRHCESCNKDVYRVKTTSELSKAIKLNRCVAITLKNESPLELITSGYIDSYNPQSK